MRLPYKIGGDPLEWLIKCSFNYFSFFVFMSIQQHSLIIIGSGPAGYTAALYASRANLQPLVITGRDRGGQLMTTTDVENWPGDAEGLTGPILMRRMHDHVVKFGAQILSEHVVSVDLRQRPFIVETEKGHRYAAASLIIATGASAQYLGLESEKQFLGRGVSGCATCDGFFYKNQTVAVVGGGNTAVEEALYLAHIAAKVYLIHRRDTLKAEKILQERLFQAVEQGKVEILWHHRLEEVIGSKDGVEAIHIVHTQDGTSKTIDLQGVFIAIGHKPNTDLFQDQLDMKEGYILTQKGHTKGSTMTSVQGVFAAGDVADPIYRQAVTSAASGCMAALDAEAFLAQHPL